MATPVRFYVVFGTVFFCISILLLLLLAYLGSPRIDRLFRMAEETYRPAPLHPKIEAVYFVQGEGELKQEELDRHPEVRVTESFDELKKFAKWRVALWIDRSTLTILNDDESKRHWFNVSPQVFYPIAFLGEGGPDGAFKILIPVNCSPKSPCASYQDGESYYGFSVFQKIPNPDVPDIVKGYKYKPQIEELLNITKALLKNESLGPLPSR